MFPPPPHLRIVVADDSALMRQRVVELLAEEAGVCVVGEAADGCEAVASVEAHHPDVLVLDLQMPCYNGLEVLARVRADAPACRVIVLTNHAEPAYRRACMTLGADGFLDKSGEIGEVCRLLEGFRR